MINLRKTQTERCNIEICFLCATWELTLMVNISRSLVLRTPKISPPFLLASYMLKHPLLSDFQMWVVPFKGCEHPSPSFLNTRKYFCHFILKCQGVFILSFFIWGGGWSGRVVFCSSDKIGAHILLLLCRCLLGPSGTAAAFHLPASRAGSHSQQLFSTALP